MRRTSRSESARTYERQAPLSNLSDAGIDEFIDDVVAVGDVGLEGGDVIGLPNRRLEQRLLACIELDARENVVADHLLKRGAGAWLALRHLATASIRFVCSELRRLWSIRAPPPD